MKENPMIQLETNMAELSEEGYGSKRAVLLLIMKYKVLCVVNSG
jgi:hypothetical protein